MDKVFTFLMIVTAMSLIFYISGLSQGNDLNMIKVLLSFDDLEGNSFYVGIFFIIVTVIGGAALIQSGLFGNASSAVVIGSVAMAQLCVSFITDILWVMGQMKLHGVDVFYYIAWAVLSLITIGFIWSLFDFVTGSD